MGPRRPHRKTKTGCSECKRRKIKCDETRPACNNCVRYSSDCKYAPSKASTSSPHAQPGLVLPTETPTSFFSTPEPSQASTFTPSIMDMELLNHWSTSTCHTLSAEATVRTIWCVKVPKIGFKCEYVLRGILALSAQHLAHFSPSNTQHDMYSSYGLNHHQKALSMASSALASVNDDNCEDLYIFSVLATLYTLAAARKPINLLVESDNGITDWLFLFRGIRSIFEYSYQTLLSSSIGPLFQAGSRRLDLQHRNPINSDHVDEFQNLRRLIQITMSDQLKINIYLEVTSKLEDSISHLLSDVRGYEPGDAFTWLYRASDEYLNLLREQAQEALSIFAFSSVIFKNLEFHWWMSGNSAHLLSSIHRLLDEEHRLWIRWPIMQAGWVAIDTP